MYAYPYTYICEYGRVQTQTRRERKTENSKRPAIEATPTPRNGGGPKHFPQCYDGVVHIARGADPALAGHGGCASHQHRGDAAPEQGGCNLSEEDAQVHVVTWAPEDI